jgi:hypothetical protein
VHAARAGLDVGAGEGTVPNARGPGPPGAGPTAAGARTGADADDDEARAGDAAGGGEGGSDDGDAAAWPCLRRAAAGAATEGFTGADLRAMVSTAVLHARRRTGGGKRADVRARDVLSALEETRPSLPPHERRRFDALYARFAGDDGAAGPANDVRAQRTALR